jgi:hypothetical protein
MESGLPGVLAMVLATQTTVYISRTYLSMGKAFLARTRVHLSWDLVSIPKPYHGIPQFVEAQMVNDKGCTARYKRLLETNKAQFVFKDVPKNWRFRVRFVSDDGSRGNWTPWVSTDDDFLGEEWELEWVGVDWDHELEMLLEEAYVG